MKQQRLLIPPHMKRLQRAMMALVEFYQNNDDLLKEDNCLSFEQAVYEYDEVGAEFELHLDLCFGAKDRLEEITVYHSSVNSLLPVYQSFIDHNVASILVAMYDDHPDSKGATIKTKLYNFFMENKRRTEPELNLLKRQCRQGWQLLSKLREAFHELRECLVPVSLEWIVLKHEDLVIEYNQEQRAERLQMLQMASHRRQIKEQHREKQLKLQMEQEQLKTLQRQQDELLAIEHLLEWQQEQQQLREQNLLLLPPPITMTTQASTEQTIQPTTNSMKSTQMDDSSQTTFVLVESFPLDFITEEEEKEEAEVTHSATAATIIRTSSHKLSRRTLWSIILAMVALASFSVYLFLANNDEGQSKSVSTTFVGRGDVRSDGLNIAPIYHPFPFVLILVIVILLLMLVLVFLVRKHYKSNGVRPYSRFFLLSCCFNTNTPSRWPSAMIHCCRSKVKKPAPSRQMKPNLKKRNKCIKNIVQIKTIQ